MDIFENIYGTMFNSDETFSRLKESPEVTQAITIISCISSIAVFLNFDYSDNILNLMWLVFSLLGAIISGLLSWLILAGFFEFITFIFDKNGKVKEFLTLSAFSFLPWILILPLELLKQQGYLGAFFAIIFEICVWIWSFKLLVTAISKTYELTLTKAFSLLLLPFFALCIAFAWMGGFFSTLIHIFKV